MEDSKNYFDITKIIRTLWEKRKLFYLVWGATFTVACAIIFPIPRTFETRTIVSPESTGSSASSSLGSIASSFGINLGNMQSNDALFPELYPDIIHTNEFVVNLFDVPVQTIDGKVNTTYVDYLTNYQKKAYYQYPKYGIHLLKNLIKGENDQIPEKINPHRLDKKTDRLVRSINDLIFCSVDKKTSVITITVLDQDPLICATIADTVRERLQEVITDYRTQKARTDAEYYRELSQEAELQYLEADREYSLYCDANKNTNMQMTQSEISHLQNKRDQSLSTYNALTNQLQIAEAKVQARTPVYTVLEPANVPVKANRPKRLIFVLVMLVLATVVTGCHTCKDELIKLFEVW